MGDKNKFATRARGNEGTRLLLKEPNGAQTLEWLQVRSIDSDAFRRERLESDRRIAKLLVESKGKAVDPQATLDEERLLLASLISAWSFDEPCTQEAVAEWFLECPQVCQEVSLLAGNRSAFFTKPASNSEPTPASSLVSPP